MPRQYSTFNQEELRAKHPDLAKAIEHLFKEQKEKLYFNLVDYIGKCKKNKVERRISIGWILETLDNYGYKVEISVSKKGERFSDFIPDLHKSRKGSKITSSAAP